jgi:putative hydrolase of the HAD superfamily
MRTRKAIFFDLDDTLLWDSKSVSEALDAVCKMASQTHSINAGQLKQVVMEVAPKLYATFPTYPFTQMIGTGPFEALWAEYREGIGFEELKHIAPVYRVEVWYQSLQKLGLDERDLATQLANAFIKERKQRSYVYEDTYQTLDQLKAQGFTLLLLTNGSPDLQKTKLQNEPKLAPYFDQIVISGSFGVGKPDPAIYQHALSLLDLSASDVLMVGDRLTTDILGANCTGIPSVWLNREHKQSDGTIRPTYEIEELAQLFPLLS